VLNGAAMSTG
jgi:hypothetical protein